MQKVLLVDRWILNSKVIEQDSQKYFEINNIDYKFFECSNAQEAINTLNNEQINIAFIDISSKDFDGIQLLRDIKSMNILQPKIVAVTVLDDKKYRYEALKLKVYRYIYKPYDFYEIQEALNKLFNNHNYSLGINDYFSLLKKEEKQEETQEDDFLDFDEFDEFDEPDETENKQEQEDNLFEFDDFDDIDEEDQKVVHSEDLMKAYNQSHKQVTAKEFLDENEEVGVIDTEQLNDLEEDLDATVASILFDDITDKIPDIIYILEKYNRFLYTFSEFEELCKVIYAMIELLENTDFDQLKRKDMASKFVVAILEDLVDWKEHVFVLEDAVDVYYINASILNSFVLLKDIVNK